MSGTELKFQDCRSLTIPEPKRYTDEYINKYRNAKLRKFVIRERLFREMGDLSGKKVLDIGCGDGEFSVLCAVLGAKVAGIDISPQLIALANQRKEINDVVDDCNFLVADLETYQFPTGEYDYIICYGVLHHTHFRDYFLRAIESLTKDGKIFIVEPVNLSRGFNNFINRLPIKKRETSSQEEPLCSEDIQYIYDNLNVKMKTGFNLMARIARALKGNNLTETGKTLVKIMLTAFNYLDYLIYPIFKKYYRVIFMIGGRQ